jgi:carboxyl-terminal processing protease
MRSSYFSTRFFSCLIALCCAKGEPALAVGEGSSSIWQGTDLDLGFLTERLTSEGCSRSDDRFLACVGAVQRVLDVQGEDLHLVPVGRRPDGPESGQLIEPFGAAVVLEDRGLRVAAEGDALEAVRARTHRILRWREWLSHGARATVDFDDLRRWLEREVIDDRRRPEFAAAAVNGFLGAADAHARIVPAADGLPTGAGGQRGAGPGGGREGLLYTGIGAGIQPMADAAMITSVVADGPAYLAGIRAQDFILRVDDTPVAGLSTAGIVERLRGPSGTEVALRLKRRDQVFDLSVRRGAVTVRNVVAYEMIDRGWQFVYLKIDSFLPPDTCRDVQDALETRLKPTLNGLILDLRDNSGGLIDQAVCVADIFLPDGETVLEIRRVDDPGQRESVRTRNPARLRVPMVTLVNGTTGSASEVLAGALQDTGRSLTVGQLTFGKGTVQTLRPWRGSRSIMEFYTAARYYRPSGVGVQLVGIEPDVPVADGPGVEPAGEVVLRERDLFPTALPREHEIWRHPDPERAALVSECATAEGLAAVRTRRARADGKPVDYPLAVGQDALVCGLTRRL